MESIIENQRKLHEELERTEDCLISELIYKKNNHRENVNSEHRVKLLLDRYRETTEKLVEIYEDKDGSRQKEIDELSAPNEFNEFYSRLNVIKEFYKDNESEIAVPMSAEFDEFKKLKENPDLNLVDFTDEEGYGKYFDLNQCFEKYLNLKGTERLEYLSYLKKFDQLSSIAKERKLNADYKNYVEFLFQYLYEFCGKVKPLIELNRVFEESTDDFNRKWEQGTVPGWSKETSSVLKQKGAKLDLSTFSSWEELASLGLDRLKLALVALNLKCGGTLEERAKRLYSIKGKHESEIDPNLFVKSSKGNDKSSKFKNVEKQKEIALIETNIMKLSEILAEQKQATIENVQRKQARTAVEREESEDSEEISQNESEDDQEDEVIYNPKNLPLGWNNKPIPYWLYKLHGLNISFNCEICGNAIYKGPKAFQMHFAEWRHAHGMRCLGIPNTAHFANITTIEDALNLWKKLKDEKQSEKFQPKNEEEYEDTEGRVVNKKTYEDLKRQGLL